MTTTQRTYDLDASALKANLRGELPGQFDLPSSHIRKHHTPSVLIAADGLSSQEIPGGAAEARADHQPQGRVAMVGMRHWEREHTGFHPARMPTVPDGPLRPAAFAKGDAPRFPSLALCIL